MTVAALSAINWAGDQVLGVGQAEGGVDALEILYRAETHFVIDFGQVALAGVARESQTLDPDDRPCARVDAAYTSGARVDVQSNTVLILFPTQYDPEAPLAIEVWSQEPLDDVSEWDHVFDVDLDCTAGGIYLEAPTWDGLDVDLPAGRYRLRFAGRGYSDQAGQLDAYRFQFWESSLVRPVELRKAWSGWAATQ